MHNEKDLTYSVPKTWDARNSGDYVVAGDPNPYFVPQLRRQGLSGRNDPCPCGSGRKYKHCHWLERKL